MPAAPKLLPALLGGLFIGVLSSLPIVSMGNLCCCLWVVSGGVLAAWVMQQNTARPVTNGEGAIVGLMAGCLGALLVLMGMAALLALSRAPIDFNEILREAAQSPEMTPEGRQALENLNPAVLIAFIGMGMFVIYAVMATLGGLLGATIFKKKLPPSGPPMPPPPTSFTPPVFSPPGPAAPPPFTPPPPPPPPSTPMSGAPSSGGTIGGPSAGLPYAPPPPAPPEEPWAGDAPTIMIPSRGPTLTPPAPAPPSGATPPQPPSTPPTPPDREPGSH